MGALLRDKQSDMPVECGPKGSTGRQRFAEVLLALRQSDRPTWKDRQQHRRNEADEARADGEPLRSPCNRRPVLRAHEQELDDAQIEVDAEVASDETEDRVEREAGGDHVLEDQELGDETREWRHP